MKIRILSFCLLLLLCVNLGNSALDVSVESSPSWGKISTVDVETLCENITNHFERHLRPENEIHDSVSVYRTFRPMSHTTLDPAPGIKYKMGIVLKKDMEIRVDDFYYFIHDFAHEFCHILHNFEITTINNPNLWFQESIACMASIWALRSMAETWNDDSPFGVSVAQDGGTAFFVKNFKRYADVYLNELPSTQYDGTSEAWLEKYENSLRQEYEQTGGFIEYHLVSQLSFKFLPIFEKNPEAWNAVRKMPASKGKMSEYMQDWHDAVDVRDKESVEAIAKEMGISIGLSIMEFSENNASENTEFEDDNIDADVNNDGYIDLYDVMIVRSGMQNSVSYDTDVNNDGITDEVDLLIVKAKAMEAIAAAAPRRILMPQRKVNLRTWGALKIRQ